MSSSAAICRRACLWGAPLSAASLVVSRQKYPAAAFIELEPDSYYTFKRKIDDMGDLTLKK